MRAYKHVAECLDHDVEAYRQLVSSLEDRFADMSFDAPSQSVDDDAHEQDVLDSVPLHDFLALTDAMVNEILLLEEEVIRWQMAIMKFLSPDWADGLDQDIFSGLSRPFL